MLRDIKGLGPEDDLDADADNDNEEEPVAENDDFPEGPEL